MSAIYGDNAVAAIAELEREFGQAKRIPLGPLHERLTNHVPGGWRADATLVDVGVCPTHCQVHRVIYCVWPSGLIERVEEPDDE
jgi:hypothetical protein